MKICFKPSINRLLLIILTILVFPLSFSCKSNKIEIKKTKVSMGTFVQIGITCNRDIKEKANLTIEESFKKIKDLGTVFDYRKNGYLNKFNNSILLKKSDSPELFDLISEAITIAHLTNGTFDPTIYPLIKLWGFDDDHPSLPSAGKIKSVIKEIDYRKLKIKNDTITKPENVKLDLSAIAKGRIVDLIRDYIKSKGFYDFIINAGGDIYISGLNREHQKWKVAIQDPFHPDKYSGILNLTNCAVVTSGDYENFFINNGKRYCHILNPMTGYPPFNMHSVTIISDNTTFSDAIATAIFVMGYKNGFEFLKINKIRGLIIYTDSNNKIIRRATNNFWD